MGPRLMYHFAMKPSDLIGIAENPNPTTRGFMLAQLEQGLYRYFVLGQGQQQPTAPNATPSSQQQQQAAPTNPATPRNVPVIGKIGEGVDKSNPDTMDEKSIINSYRRYTT
jgi:hypothetical protein